MTPSTQLVRDANIESSQVATYQLASNEVKGLGHRQKDRPNNNETCDEPIHAFRIVL